MPKPEPKFPRTWSLERRRCWIERRQQLLDFGMSTKEVDRILDNEFGKLQSQKRSEPDFESGQDVLKIDEPDGSGSVRGS